MTKNEFIEELNNRLQGYKDKDDIVNYYFELIQDRMDNGEFEEDIIREYSIDEIVNNLKNEGIHKSSDDGIILYKNAKQEESFIEDSPKDELTGGRKFWYIVWTIATILFCIISVCIEVSAISTIVGGAVVCGLSSILFTGSIGLGIIVVGLGLIIISCGIIGTYFARVLRKFMFRNRLSWNANVKNHLGGKQ